MSAEGLAALHEQMARRSSACGLEPQDWELLALLGGWHLHAFLHEGEMPFHAPDGLARWRGLEAAGYVEIIESNWPGAIVFLTEWGSDVLTDVLREAMEVGS